MVFRYRSEQSRTKFLLLHLFLMVAFPKLLYYCTAKVSPVSPGSSFPPKKRKGVKLYKERYVNAPTTMSPFLETTKKFANFSFVNLVFIFRSSSSTTNPLCERRVDLLVCSLPLHRHSYIGFILAFASSFHNKQVSSKKKKQSYLYILGRQVIRQSIIHLL